MTSGKKTLLLILSIVPLILFGIWIYFYVQWIMDFIPQASAYENNPDLILQSVGSLFGISAALMLPAGLISLGLLIYYIIQLVNNKTMETGERVVWIIMLIIFCPLTFIIYWLMRVRTMLPPGTLPPVQPVYPQGPTYS